LGFPVWPPFSIRDDFRNSVHGVIVKTVAVVDLRRDTAQRYSPSEATRKNKRIEFRVKARASN
jgi:hypothetical protein